MNKQCMKKQLKIQDQNNLIKKLNVKRFLKYILKTFKKVNNVLVLYVTPLST